jgi:PAS domain S-box-containing protein
MPDQVKQPKGTFHWKRIYPGSIIWVFLFLIVGLLHGCRTEQTPIPQTDIKSITVVVDNNYPPYSFLDADGQLVGISIDQWNLWEKKTGVKVKIVGMSWSGALTAMENGQFDVIDTIFYNESRGQILDFTPPYATIDVPIYFNNEISGITDASTVRGFTVAVKSGDAVIDVLQQAGSQNLVYYENYKDIIKAAAEHTVTVFAIDKPPADYFLYQYGIQKDFNSTKPLFSGQFHRAVKKGNTELLNLVNAGFANISQTEYEVINQKYLGSEVINLNTLKYGIYVIAAVLVGFLLLVIWNRTLQVQVNKKTQVLKDSEDRYKELFEESPISLWEEDFSAAIQYLALLREQHGKDLHSYLLTHPDEIFRCFERIKVLDVNKATLELFKAKNKEQVIGNLKPLMFESDHETLVDELMHIADRIPVFNWEATNVALSGEKISARIRWVAEPGHEKNLDRVILSLVDMTAIRDAEKELRLAHDRLNMAVSAANLGVFEYDLVSGNMIWDNRMFELYSKDRNAFVPNYQNWLACLVPADRIRMDQLIKKVINGEKDFETTFRISSRDGGLRHMKAFGQLVMGKDLCPQKLIGINFDITKIMEIDRVRTKVSDIQWKIVHAEKLDDIYEIVASGIYSLLGDCIVWVTKVDDEKGTIRIKNLMLNKALRKRLDKIGVCQAENVDYLISDIPKDDLHLLRSGKFERYKFGLRQLGTWKIPEAIRKVIEDELNYKFIYKMGFVFEGKHMGGVSVISQRDLGDKADSVETVMNQATLALKRIISETELQRSEAQLRSLFEQSPLGILTSNVEFRFTSINSAFCKMIGYSEAEIRKMTFSELTHPDDLSESVKFMKKLSAGEIGLFSIEKRYIKKDKTTMWGNTIVKAIYDENQRINSYLVMVEDITERKLSEAKLAEERQKVRVLMDTVPDSVYFKDLESRFTSANQATLKKFGLSDPREIIGKSDHDFFDDENSKIADEEEQTIIQTGQPIIGIEEMEVWPNKHIRWVSKTKMPLFDEKGNITGTFGVIRDITERKQQEEEIRRLNADLEKKVESRTKELRLKNQELEAFTYTVSHDLKAPLRGISGYADILLQDHSDKLDEDGKGYLNKLIKSSQQLSQLIEDLLSYSRLERRPLIYGDVQVKSIVNILLEQRGEEIKNRNIVIHVNCVSETIKSSHELLTQIIGNYLDNALKFTQRQSAPEIWLNYENHGDTSLFSIKDNGVGFDEKFKEKIFEVFQRLHTQDVFPGTGIGLALVKKSAELLGYRVWAEGEPGKGATFYLEVVK